ncbi:MAG: acyl-[acyl-carrier-protein]--UDP-N-acetylglucosamine O-acyltransferase, partial [Myxococcota bacterium]
MTGVAAANRSIHPTAVVDPAAEIGPGVRIGPFAVVGPNVKLGAGCVIHAHVVVDGDTELGPGVEVFPQAVLGMAPQDLKFDGRRTRLRVGARTIVREGATLHPGSSNGEGLTEVGQDVLIMAYCHVAHDCR